MVISSAPNAASRYEAESPVAVRLEGPEDAERFAALQPLDAV